MSPRWLGVCCRMWGEKTSINQSRSYRSFHHDPCQKNQSMGLRIENLKIRCLSAQGSTSVQLSSSFRCRSQWWLKLSNWSVGQKAVWWGIGLACSPHRDLGKRQNGELRASSYSAASSSQDHQMKMPRMHHCWISRSPFYLACRPWSCAREGRYTRPHS
jgi:hypothetical protein